jgi:hypothetical protein
MSPFQPKVDSLRLNVLYEGLKAAVDGSPYA